MYYKKLWVIICQCSFVLLIKIARNIVLKIHCNHFWKLLYVNIFPIFNYCILKYIFNNIYYVFNYSYCAFSLSINNYETNTWSNWKLVSPRQAAKNTWRQVCSLYFLIIILWYYSNNIIVVLLFAYYIYILVYIIYKDTNCRYLIRSTFHI